MKKAFFVLFFVVLAIGVVLAQSTTTELSVWGMTCNRCVTDVTRTVRALDGVSNVRVNLRARTVTVEHDATRINVETIIRAIEARGYNVL